MPVKTKQKVSNEKEVKQLVLSSTETSEVENVFSQAKDFRSI